MPAATAWRDGLDPGITCRCWRASPARWCNGALQGLGPACGAGARAAQISGSDDGDRQMVSILAAVLTDGLPAVEAACAEALAEGVHPPT